MDAGMAPFHECPSGGSHAPGHTHTREPHGGAGRDTEVGLLQGRHQERTPAPTGQLMSTAQGLCPMFWILVFILYHKMGLSRLFQKLSVQNIGP